VNPGALARAPGFHRTVMKNLTAPQRAVVLMHEALDVMLRVGEAIQRRSDSQVRPVVYGMRGLRHRRPGNRAKSLSVVTRSQPCSIASAAR